MRKFAYILAVAMAAISATASVVPIGANQDWTTDLTIRNPTGDVIIQKIGHLTYVHPPLDPVVQEATITIQPGETRRFARVDQYYDNGLWSLDVDPRLDSTVYLTFKGTVARFEIDGIQKTLDKAGDGVFFYKVVVDAKIGTFPLVMNRGTAAVQVEFQLYAPDGRTQIGDWTASAPPGTTLFGIPGSAKDGGTLRICHTLCGAGINAPNSQLAVVVIVGPPDGGTQSQRQPK